MTTNDMAAAIWTDLTTEERVQILGEFRVRQWRFDRTLEQRTEAQRAYEEGHVESDRKIAESGDIALVPHGIVRNLSNIYSCFPPQGNSARTKPE